MFTTIGITTKREIENKEDFCKLIDFLVKQGKTVTLSSHARKNIDDQFPELKDIDYSKPFDLLIAYGGDGTILRAARHVKFPKTTSVLGINAGHLGFLSAIHEKDWAEELQSILDGEHLKVHKTAISVSLTRKNEEKFTAKVLNDAVISYKNAARLVTIEAKVNDLELCRYKADGLIISTPTGSTAYNLSAGGPIVYPSIRGMIVTPICSFSMTQKPIVLPGEKNLSLSFQENDELLNLTLDGQRTFEIQQDDILTLTMEEEPIMFLKKPEDNYFHTIRQKLHWGDSLR